MLLPVRVVGVFTVSLGRVSLAQPRNSAAGLRLKRFLQGPSRTSKSKHSVGLISQPKPKTCHKTSLRLRANSDTPLERAADCRTLRFVLLSQPSKGRTIHQSKTCCRIIKSRTKKSGTSRTNYAEEERVWRKGVPTTGEDTQPRHSRQCLRTRQNDG